RFQEAGAGILGHLPDRQRPVRRPAGRRHPHRRRPGVLPGAGPRAGRRAHPHAGRHIVLSAAMDTMTKPVVSATDIRKVRPTGLDRAIIAVAIGNAFRKLDPRSLAKNPVMFVVEVVSILTTVLLVRDLVAGNGGIGFTVQIVFWLWFTVVFANFAEAV